MRRSDNVAGLRAESQELNHSALIWEGGLVKDFRREKRDRVRIEKDVRASSCAGNSTAPFPCSQRAKYSARLQESTAVGRSSRSQTPSLFLPSQSQPGLWRERICISAANAPAESLKATSAL